MKPVEAVLVISPEDFDCVLMKDSILLIGSHDSTILIMQFTVPYKKKSASIRKISAKCLFSQFFR